MGLNTAVAAANMATSNEEDISLFKARKRLDTHLLLIYRVLHCSMRNAVRLHRVFILQERP